MKETITIVSIWLHIASAVIWIGGIFFILIIAIPSARLVLGAESGRLMAELSKRFTRVANFSIMSLAITGVIVAALNWGMIFGTLGERQTQILLLKLVIFFAMVVIHIYRQLVLSPRISRSDSETAKAALQAFSLNLVKINFAAGLVILLLSGSLAILSR